ncbi:MAG: DUF4332 domain-containing protein [Pseudomonadota bacterium]
MTLLFSLIRAAHARGTHHKLALDALLHLDRPDAQRWQRLYLKHAALYMEGAKAPDTEFKDFKNHVCHVRDGLWGGAPAKARSWYNHLVEALACGNWEMAVYCTGVLSHYYADPIHPFHTAQSQAESDIHRAVEWSISKTYDDLRGLGLKAHPEMLVPVSAGPNGVAEAVVAGARHANPHYEMLIAHYNFDRGVVAPEEGLDAVAQPVVGGLLVYAAAGIARLLERAIDETDAKPPEVALSVDAFLAGLSMPLHWVTRRMADARERVCIERMYDELQQRGRVEEHLPEDDRAVRNAFAAEVEAKRTQPATADVFPVGRSVPRKCMTAAGAASVPVASVPIDRGVDLPGVADMRAEDGAGGAKEAQADRPSQTLQTLTDTTAACPSAPSATATPAIEPAALHRVPVTSAKVTGAQADDLVFYCAMDDAIVDAPSIGPKTARRLQPLGILTVRDLLAADPEQTARRLKLRYVKAQTVVDWQDQARLVCAVPRLRGTHAQLLVGAGFRSVDAIAQAQGDDLFATLLHFAASPAGQRVLREGQPPGLDLALAWIARAQAAQAAKAA